MVQILSGIQGTAAALAAEQVRLDVISENIANATVTHGVDGKPYQRKVVVFENALQQALGGANTSDSAPALSIRIDRDHRPPTLVYQPGNPEADARGMVAMPTINVHEEMADMISASRAFEANLAVVKNARAIALQALSIGKR